MQGNAKTRDCGENRSGQKDPSRNNASVLMSPIPGGTQPWVMGHITRARQLSDMIISLPKTQIYTRKDYVLRKVKLDV